MLARLEADPSIGEAYVARDGAQLLVSARAVEPGASVREAMLEALTRVLAESELRPTAESPAAARIAWAERHRLARWLPRAGAWRLSWREAEQFADRFVAWLSTPTEQAGPIGAPPLARGAPSAAVGSASPLRALLVELFFGDVEPVDAPGPEPTAWSRASDRAARVAVIVRAARPVLDAPALAALEQALGDPERTREIVRDVPAPPGGPPAAGEGETGGGRADEGRADGR